MPDLLAHFDAAGPVLIEVKAKQSRTLSFTPDYLARLTAYADLLGSARRSSSPGSFTAFGCCSMSDFLMAAILWCCTRVIRREIGAFWALSA